MVKFQNAIFNKNAPVQNNQIGIDCFFCIFGWNYRVKTGRQGCSLKKTSEDNHFSNVRTWDLLGFSQCKPVNVTVVEISIIYVVGFFLYQLIHIMFYVITMTNTVQQQAVPFSTDKKGATKISERVVAHFQHIKLRSVVRHNI